MTIRHTLIALFAVGTLLTAGCNETKYVHVGPNWDALHKLDNDAGNFEVSAKAGSSYEVGDALKLSARSEKEGRLWVVQVDSTDAVSLLYPNQLHPDNHIEADETVSIPPEGVDWTLEADEPLGESVVAFIVTTGGMSLQDALGCERSMLKALVLVGPDADWGIAKKVIEVTKK